MLCMVIGLYHCNANNYFLKYNTRSGAALQAVFDGVFPYVYQKNWTLKQPDKPNEIILAHLIACLPSSVCPSENFSHFHLSWVVGIQVCSNEGPRHFSRENNYEITKMK